MQRNEAVDSGVLYGLLNGARGIGYVAGGLASVPLLKAGQLGTKAIGPVWVWHGVWATDRVHGLGVGAWWVRGRGSPEVEGECQVRFEES